MGRSLPGILAAVGLVTLAACGNPGDAGCGEGSSAPTVLVHTAMELGGLLGRAAQTATFVAAQDGTCPPEALTGTGGEYAFTARGRYAVVVVCADQAGGPRTQAVGRTV